MTMPSRKFLLTVFALLDMAVFGSMTYALAWPDAEVCEGNMYAMQLAQLLFTLSLPVAALGLCYRQRWALRLSYLQLPIRIGTQAWSLGILLHFNALLDPFSDWLVPGLNQPLSIALLAVIAFEIARLAITISLDLRWHRKTAK